MRKFLDRLYKNQSLIYKYFLYVVSVCFIVFFFPKGGKFKYEFQKGKPWQYDNLYAPFDFSIKKTDAEIAEEKSAITASQTDYYRYDQTVADEVYNEYNQDFQNVFTTEKFDRRQLSTLKKTGREILDELYNNGILKRNDSRISGDVYVVKDQEALQLASDNVYNITDVESVIDDILNRKGLRKFRQYYQELFFDIVAPNVFYDSALSQKALEEELSKLSYTRGNVDEGKLIIVKGEVVEAENLTILNSLKAEYESELWTENNYIFILLGYTIHVALVLMMLFLFLKRYRPEIFRNNTKVTFIFFNILLNIFCSIQ